MDPESVNTTETMEIDISKEAGGLPNILDTSTLCHLHRLLLFVVEKGLSTCWVGMFVESQVKELLKIPKEVNVEAILPIGYSNEKPEKKAKIELDSILYFNKYGEKEMKQIKKLSA